MSALKILVLDDHIPYPELGVGYPRARLILQAFESLGWSITFLPLERPHYGLPGSDNVLLGDVEIVMEGLPERLAAFLHARLEEFDRIWVSRPSNMRLFRRALAEAGIDGPVPRVVYDSEAIFTVREIGRRHVEGAKDSDADLSEMMSEEMALARWATHVTAVSVPEAETFRCHGCPSVSLLQAGFDSPVTHSEFAERRDLLFVGALDDPVSPNVDAVSRFVADIWGRIRASNDAVRFHVAGRAAGLSSSVGNADGVRVLGQVGDLMPLYESSRVFVAPSRYGAGIGWKVLEAAAHGVPVVTTSVLADQLRWRDGREVLVADTPERFAERVLELYSGSDLWRAVRMSALDAIHTHFSLDAFRAGVEEALCAAGR